MDRKKIILLGATGSIGDNTLQVVRRNPDRLALFGIAAFSKIEALANIANEFAIKYVTIFDEIAYKKARDSNLFAKDVHLNCGLQGLTELASLPDADIAVIAVPGTICLHPTLAALQAGNDVALASKEVLVLAGKFVMDAAKKHGRKILPADSEHNAIFQCLQNSNGKDLARVILTASGGPFRDYSSEQMKTITREDALKHPNWSMGPKITVDSSTMANKGLEVIEAHWLFGRKPDEIQVVVHPQSIIHSLVEFIDGSILAQLSPPSMTFALQHTLLYPDRSEGVTETLDFSQVMQFDFRPPDIGRFPCLRLAREALVSGGTAPAAFNASNEEAVSAFLENRIEYLTIPNIIERTLETVSCFEPQNLDQVLEFEASAREVARSKIANYES